MILYVFGLDNDKTLIRFLKQATEKIENVEFINLHKLFYGEWLFDINSNNAKLKFDERVIELDLNGAYFNRLVDISQVIGKSDAAKWRAMIIGIGTYLELVKGPVINRPGNQLHNGTKPFHEWWLAKRGFKVPNAITTTTKAEILNFIKINNGRAIVKTICGMRGTAQVVSSSDFNDYTLEYIPVHLQKVIDGYDVRVHVVNKTFHCEKIISEGYDYRDKESNAEYCKTDIPIDLKNKILIASSELGLAFTGWDFKVDSNNTYWCLEANPMPGYDVYDRRCNGEISNSLIKFLVDGIRT